MTCDFKSILTVFQSYQDDRRVIIKGYVQLQYVYGGKDFPLQWISNLGPLDQQTSALPPELLGLPHVYYFTQQNLS